ncbi:VSP [Giardia lamblia P15]|uniref:VSP n=1 Tax=Giardia intestinalis (strain P15) TaxID=658858 RepID=E1F2Q5_GIAIA|nr:VSP [Giardia lamblia P15]
MLSAPWIASSMFDRIFFGIIILQATQAAETCPKVSDESSQPGTCKKDNCNVWIGGSSFCSQCSTAAEYLINGKCIDTNTESACENTPDNGVCTSCKAGFFLHRGGCYKIGTEPGNLVCEDMQASQTQGTCDVCRSGYFRNPFNNLDKTKESCIACNQTTAIDGSTGVANCQVCNPLETPGTVVCALCEDGKFGETCATDCNADCKSCSAGTANDCTSCNGGKYLKVANEQATSGQCVEKVTCTSTYFPITADEKCYPCNTVSRGGVDGCTACSKPGDSVICTACTGIKKPNSAGTHCFECPTEGCEKCSADNACEKCSGDKKLTPTKECVDKCEELGGYFDGSDNNCEKCSPTCKTCTKAANQCSSCPAKKVLEYNSESNLEYGGTCIDECTVGANGCAECGATIGEAKYCSKCSDASKAPLNGNCTVNARASASCTQIENGVCKKCTADYFLFEGGCYQTTRQPGMQICSAIDGATGLCQTCANGLAADKGDCSAQKCHITCKICSIANDPSQCKRCAAGYYKQSDEATAGKCDPCSQGNDGCTLCKYSTTFICLSTDSLDDDGTDTTPVDPPSSNKSGLSTGAIAGISVAAIVVVGGLVGFLCWWFICRGKA